TIKNLLLEYKKNHSFELEAINFVDWDDFLYISSKLEVNSGLLIYLARPGGVARNDFMKKISKYLRNYFSRYNYILFYPEKEKK
ncbi:MAG: hypothetical protein FWG20_06175, partial [Candidatus Cloacimonetes bacterium]|nr:hypothetical protein [Candidatus Cloacimonadota bacterium]